MGDCGLCCCVLGDLRGFPDRFGVVWGWYNIVLSFRGWVLCGFLGGLGYGVVFLFSSAGGFADFS